MKFPVPVILLIAAAVGVLIAQPFVPYGDAIRPGLGNLMNGGAGFILLIAALVAALIIRRRG